MKVVKKKTIKYKLVVPETKEEKEELDKLIEDAKEEENIDPNDFKWLPPGELAGD